MKNWLFIFKMPGSSIKFFSAAAVATSGSMGSLKF
jgi:hypothetical protein